MSYKIEKYFVNKINQFHFRFAQRHQTDMLINNLTGEQIDAYEQLVSSSMQIQVQDLVIYISEVKSDKNILHFSSVVQKYLDEQKLPIVFAIGEYDNSIVIVGKSNHFVFHIGSILSYFENGGGNALSGKYNKKIKNIF